jgi:hypothetical protein
MHPESRRQISHQQDAGVEMLAVEGFDKGFTLPRPHALKD